MVILLKRQRDSSGCSPEISTRSRLLDSLNRNPAYRRIDEPTALQKAALAEFRRASSGYEEYRELLHLQYPDSVRITTILEGEEN